MKKIFALISSTLLAGALSQVGPVSGADSIYKLTQQSCTRGSMSVYASKTAVFAESSARGYCIVCQAPDWKIVTYSPKSKRYYQEDLLHWMSKSQVNVIDLLAQKIVEMRSQSSSRQSLLHHSVTVLQMRQNVDTHLRENRVLHEKEYGAYYVCDDLQLPQMVSNFLVWLYILPPVAPASGIPLKFDYVDIDGGKYMRLNTLSLTNATFDSSRLKIPAGYTRVDSETMVLMDQSNENALEELLGPRSSSLRRPGK